MQRRRNNVSSPHPVHPPWRQLGTHCRQGSKPGCRSVVRMAFIMSHSPRTLAQLFHVGEGGGEGRVGMEGNLGGVEEMS